jgi:hypothetical protein
MALHVIEKARQGCDGHAYESVLRPAAHLR